jgi:dolichyl-phosphate beta-glucosyltransferase
LTESGDALDLSVVVPCFNEERRIAAAIEAILGFLDGLSLAAEVVIVDDGSRDATADTVERRFAADARVRLLRCVPNRGKGWAVREGLRASRGRLVLFTDADLATPIAEVAKLRAKAEEGFDLVIASRVVPGANVSKAQPLRRRVAGAAFRGLVRALGLTSFRDTQCGFKLMRRATVGPILEEVSTHRYAFDVELLSRAERAGLRIAELPVEWRDGEGSNLRLYPDAVRMARDLIRIRWRLGGRAT